MAIDATTETFEDLVSNGVVLVDVWGPRCAPCLALMPQVEALAEANSGTWTLVKLDATKNRPTCLRYRIMTLPTYVVFADGREVQRLIGAEVTVADIETAIESIERR